MTRQLLLQRRDRALLDLRVFSSFPFTLSIVAMVIAMATMMGTFILVPFFAQSVLGLSPFATGLLTLPGGLLMGVAGPIVGRIYDARGPRILVIPGALLISAGVWTLSSVTPGTSLWLLLGANAMLCVGLAATFTPLMTLALGSVPPQRYSHGSAVVGTLQQVAGAAGTALFVTVMTVVSTGDAQRGASVSAATSNGVATVFTVAGFISLALIAVVLFVRRTPAVTDGTAAVVGSPAPGEQLEPMGATV